MGCTHEFLGGGVARLVDAAAREHLPHGKCEDLHIEEEGAVIDIPHVERELLFPGERVSAGDLREPGDARTNFVTAGLFGCVAFEVLRQKRSRAYKASTTREVRLRSARAARLPSLSTVRRPGAVLRARRGSRSSCGT
jgi:hypothetical protein